MKKLFTSAAVLSMAVLIVCACHKTSNPTPSPSSSSTGSTTGPGSGGLFTVSDIFTTDLSAGTKDSSGAAQAQPVGSVSTGGTVSIGAVTCDGDSLGFMMGAYSTTLFSMTALPPFNGSPVWKITGGGGYSAFTYTCSKPMPSIRDLHLTFTSFSHTSNFVISHQVINCDTIKYSITDDNGNNIIKAVHGPSSGFTFTPAMMGTLVPCTNAATLQILGGNYFNSVQGGKNIYFINAAEYNLANLTIN